MNFSSSTATSTVAFTTEPEPPPPDRNLDPGSGGTLIIGLVFVGLLASLLISLCFCAWAAISKCRERRRQRRAVEAAIERAM